MFYNVASSSYTGFGLALLFSESISQVNILYMLTTISSLRYSKS